MGILRGRGQRLDRRVSSNRDTETFMTVVSVSSIVDRPTSTLCVCHGCLCVHIPRECVSFGLDFNTCITLSDRARQKVP